MTSIALAIKWFLLVIRDALHMGFVNRSPWQSLVIVGLLLFGLLITASQISAPFIYALF